MKLQPYRTEQFETLDEIALKFYGSTTMTEEILKHNPIASFSTHFQGGEILFLPIIENKKETKPRVSLWD